MKHSLCIDCVHLDRYRRRCAIRSWDREPDVRCIEACGCFDDGKGPDQTAKQDPAMTNEEAIEWLDVIISRHEVEDEWVTLTGRGYYDALSIAVEALKQQRTGAWVWDSYYGGFYRCSVCGYEQGRKTKYCPECGARMTEVADD